MFPRVRCRLSEMISARDISRGRLACLYYCRTDSSAPPSTDSPAPFVPPGVSYSTSTQCNFMSQYCVHLPAMGHDQPQKHGFQNIKGVFSHCAGAFSVGNDCVHSRTACECRKFSSVATLKVLFFRMVPCFFALQVVFVFVPLARFWDFRKCFHAHKWAGACFPLYDIGQTGATSRPLPECAPRSGRDTRTPCPR